MTNEDIQALISSAIEEAVTGLREEFTNANKGLASNLTKELRKAVQNLTPVKEEDTAQEETNQKLSLKALESQLTDLRNQLAEKDRETLLAKRSNAISQAIVNAKALNPTALQKLFTLEYGDSVKEEGGNWYVDRGDTVVPLNEALNNYLQSEEGKFYLPPSNVSGAGSEEVKTNPSTIDKPLDAASALYEAFSNY